MSKTDTLRQQPNGGQNGAGPYSPELSAVLQKAVPEGLEKNVSNSGVPRATKAVSHEKPDGSKSSPSDRTVLQQHVDYWDFDNDGKIYPLDTYRGFCNIGFPRIMSFIAIFVIHGTFSYWSQDSWMPDPFFSLLTKNIHRTRHGSDSQTYDPEGRFVPEKFEEIFSKHDKANKGGLYLREMIDMAKNVRKIMDPVGWSAMAFEWGATYYLLHNKEGYVSKEHIRGVYDGSLFYQLDEANSKRKSQHKSKKHHKSQHKSKHI
ncbi:hypothetical protein WJX73_007320 [Symbiochloris irregularis]|uniref:Caleosin n=1 Tax=Symbiochloris irregularis TaxID=706552 RepID=A0AAW1PIW9_9CHLO